jgi:hypothetical protein
MVCSHAHLLLPQSILRWNSSKSYTCSYYTGGYAVTFGQEWSREDFAESNSADSFVTKLAVSFAAGAQMGWFSLMAINTPGYDRCGQLGIGDLLLDPKYDREIAFMRELVSARQLMSKYLVYGRLRKPLKPTVQLVDTQPHRPTPPAISSGLSLSSSAAGAKAVAHPGVVHAVWQEQKGDALGVFLMSVISPQYIGASSTSHLKVGFTMVLADYGLDSRASYTASSVAADGSRTPLAKSAAGLLPVSVTIGDLGRGLLMLEVAAV